MRRIQNSVDIIENCHVGVNIVSRSVRHVVVSCACFSQKARKPRYKEDIEYPGCPIVRWFDFGPASQTVAQQQTNEESLLFSRAVESL